MYSLALIVLSIFAGAQCQIFAPYPRAVPAVVPSCPCGNPAPVPLPVPVPAVLPGRPCANPPLNAIVPACGCGNPAPLPVLKTPLGYEPAFNPVIEAPLPLSLASLALGNPFLPAASPVSALAPFSPLLPPANTCSRCQYLKKIPIPPPCI
ncbi:uncharacterized protein LOC118280006 [Spodoptera frugiperda]|uniref:Uncharacterized protein LOC118280006 n=1 Tax=Spodoptera frugiperda TaxID=7108 RepID=A0A9R0E534_SPOFR|nr:uncharacterized protein LOC118280006 [Spodoptera frugiperda]